MNVKTIAIAGLGNQGRAYLRAANDIPGQAKVIAIADHNKEKLEQLSKQYGISEELCYESVEDMLAQPKLADLIFICTQDRQHVPQAIQALEKGYDVLLEKPISPDHSECRRLLEVQRRTGRKVVVCHVLRYTPFFRKVKQLISDGEIGHVISIQASENVQYWHQIHSYVRGKSSNSITASPMFLQKCCHDMDLMVWLTESKCKSLSSFGSRFLFRSDMAPEGATARCLDGCAAKEACPFDAEKIYVTNDETGIAKGNTGWPCSMLAFQPNPEKIYRALKEGPFGKCVYHADNNVVDHQIVSMEMENGIHISFSMGMTAREGREMKIMGSTGTILADVDSETIELIPFGDSSKVFNMKLSAEQSSGHAGGDKMLVRQFVEYSGGTPCDGISSLENSVESHFICMAAEESMRNGGSTILMQDFR